EKAVPQVAVKDPGHGLKGRRPTVHQDLGGFLVDGKKEGDAQQVVPMAMAEEQVDFDGSPVLQQTFPQGAQAGAAVDDEASSGVKRDFHTGGVAPELQG